MSVCIVYDVIVHHINTVFIRIDATTVTINFRTSEVWHLLKAATIRWSRLLESCTNWAGAGHTLAMQFKITIASFAGNTM